MICQTPVLAWILTALTCFLADALVGEGWGRAAASPVFPTVGVVVTVAVAFQLTATPEPTLLPTLTPIPDPAEPTATPRPGGTGNVQ